MSAVINPPSAPAATILERYWSVTSGTSGVAPSTIVYMACGEGLTTSIGGSPISGQTSTKKLRASSFSLRQTVGTGAGLIRYKLYKSPGVDSGVYFETNVTTAYIIGEVVGTYDFVPGTDELILMCLVNSGTVTGAPTRINVAVLFTEVP